MSPSDAGTQYKSKLRICQLRTWPNYAGHGIIFENSDKTPCAIGLVESNSPAAAGGIKIRDVIIAVNGEDVTDSDYTEVERQINSSLEDDEVVELFVIEEQFYKAMTQKQIPFDRQFAKTLETPKQIPRDYMNFRENVPRECTLTLTQAYTTFGIEITPGENDKGVYIQDIQQNSLASTSKLRKNDRIIEINDKFVDDEPIKSIREKMMKAKEKGSIKLYVLDTKTYANFKNQKIPLASKKFKKTPMGKKWAASSHNDDQDGKKYKNLFFIIVKYRHILLRSRQKRGG